MLKKPKRRPRPDAVHVSHALDFHHRWNVKAGLDGLPADPDLTRGFVQYLAEEIAIVENGAGAWNRAIDACVGELRAMQNEDAQRLLARIKKLVSPAPARGSVPSSEEKT